MRKRFDNKLDEIRGDILRMGSIVDEELQLALKALKKKDTDLAQQVIVMDDTVNEMRFDIEDKCVLLIATQQPAATDLRAIVAVMNMIVDLERMGDQAKGVAKLVPALEEIPDKWVRWDELQQMGELVRVMLKDAMTAYAENNIELAGLIADQDNEVDSIYARVHAQVMESMTEAKKQKKVEAAYDILRAARELERYGDLATNVADRVTYIATGLYRE
jgi:phosphate transport system protein